METPKNRKTSGQNITLVWKPQKAKKIDVPIRLLNTTSKDYGYSGSLICTDCKATVKQEYICTECGEKSTIGDLPLRQDKETKIIYEDSIKKEYLNANIKKEVKVIKEVKTNDLLQGVEFFKDYYEIYNSDEDFIPVILKIRDYLQRNNIGLLVTFGINQRNRAGIIIATYNKMLLIEIRDARLIKEHKQIEIKENGNGLTKELKKISVSDYPKMYDNFLKHTKQGKKIVIPKKESKAAKIDTSFLDA